MDSEREDLTPYLRPGPFMEARHPAVVAFAAEAVEGITVDDPGAGGETGTGGGAGERARAVALYNAVRDGIRYDPYRIDLRPQAMKASATLQRGYGFCIAKAVVLGAAARAQGIPARLGFGDVRNHLTTPRLRRSMGTDVFVWHGYTELFIEGKWVKATPAFNRSLCLRFGVPVMDFDGVHDAVFQPFDGEGKRYMEYLKDHGRFAELPLKELRAGFEAAYPTLMSGGRCDLTGQFEEDAQGGWHRKGRSRDL